MANPNSAKFPAALVQQADLPVGTNSYSATLSSGITNVATTLSFTDISALNVPCLLRIDDEIILAPEKSNNNLVNCTRGFDGTTPSPHTAGSSAEFYIFAHHYNQISAEVIAIQTLLGINGANFLAANDPLVTERIVGVHFKSAAIIGGSPVLAFNTPETGGPTAAAVTGSNVILAVAQFAQSNYVQDFIVLPSDWTGQIDFILKWRSSDTSGNVTWEVSTAGSTTGVDPAWNSANTGTTTVSGSSGNINTTTISNVTTTGLIAGALFFFKIARGGADTLSGTADLISVTVNIRRNF